MAAMWGLLNTMQMCEGGWEKSYKTGRTPIWNKSIEMRLYPRTSQHAITWVCELLLKHFRILMRHIILVTKPGDSSTVSVLLEDVLLHSHSHPSPPLRSYRNVYIYTSWTTARCHIYDPARLYSMSIHSLTTLWLLLLCFRQWLQPYTSWHQTCVCRSSATSCSGTYSLSSTLEQRSTWQDC